MKDRERELLHSSKNEHWCTPPEFLDHLYKFGQVELDPCSNICSIVQAKKAILPPEDGLQVPWKVDSGIVYVNPPYGRKVGHWVQKAVAEHKEHGTEIVMLLPARVDTRWFQQLIFPTASRVLFWKGRMAFIDATNPTASHNPATFPSAVVYWGPRTLSFDVVFKSVGTVCQAV